MTDTFVNSLTLLELLSYSQEPGNESSLAVRNRIAAERAQLSSEVLKLSKDIEIAANWPSRIRSSCRTLYGLVSRVQRVIKNNQKLRAPQGKRNLLTVELLLVANEGLKILLKEKEEEMPSQEEIDAALARMRHAISLVEMAQVHFSSDG
uniref:Uncharacterized protein n=1 Tax=Trichuris muris TaxID=70415 RepID=A0A5S6QR20_TRIMR